MLNGAAQTTSGATPEYQAAEKQGKKIIVRGNERDRGNDRDVHTAIIAVMRRWWWEPVRRKYPSRSPTGLQRKHSGCCKTQEKMQHVQTLSLSDVYTFTMAFPSV
jgi:hypothetical protein